MSFSVLLLGFAISADPIPASTWRFESEPGEVVQVGTVIGKPVISADVPNRFTYDPLTRKSAANNSSMKVAGKKAARSGVQVPIASVPTAGFTLEGFAKPNGLVTESGQYYPFLGKSRRTNQAADARFNVFTSYPGHVYDWFQAAVTPPGVGHDKARHLEYTRYGGPTMNQKEFPWRHFALVMSADHKSATYYVDYTPLSTLKFDEPLTWDDGPVFIGGEPSGNGFNGLIDEVRWTPRPLVPSQFLHAVPHALENVDLASPEGKLPRGTGYADIRERFGAVGDGKTDDTHAFQKAFRDLSDNTHIVGAQTLYIPNGTYVVSDTIRFSRYLTIHGESREKTIIYLRDNSEKFRDAKTPRPVLSSGFQPWDQQVKHGPGGNVTHGNYVYDLTINTGYGNHGAIGFDYQGHNNSAIYNIGIRSGDGSGITGLDLTRPWPGPCLIRDLHVIGYDVGIRSRHSEYSFTVSRAHLTKQRLAGIENQSNGVAIEELTSENTVPAIINRTGGGQIVVINSKLTGGANDTTAIVNEKDGSLFARNIATEGYQFTIRDGEQTVPPGKVEEYLSGETVTAFPVKSAKSLNLPVEQPPEVPWGTPKDWVSVRDFEGKVNEGDWSPAIQAAIDSGAKTVYFPINGTSPQYLIKKPVHVRGSVVRLFGHRVGIPADTKSLNGQPQFVFDGPQEAVSIEGLEFDSAKHASRVDLLFRYSNVNRLDAEAGCGKLFLEDFLQPLKLNKHQRVWARHLNIETDKPKIINDGGQMWVLGYKTEVGGVNLQNTGGAKTEILGGLVYVTTKPGLDVPMIDNRDSDVSCTQLISSYVGGHTLFAKDTRGNQTRDMKSSDVVKWLAGRSLVQMYVGKRE